MNVKLGSFIKDSELRAVVADHRIYFETGGIAGVSTTCGLFRGAIDHPAGPLLHLQMPASHIHSY